MQAAASLGLENHPMRMIAWSTENVGAPFIANRTHSAHSNVPGIFRGR